LELRSTQGHGGEAADAVGIPLPGSEAYWLPAQLEVVSPHGFELESSYEWFGGAGGL
jgi:hypothetical protein